MRCRMDVAYESANGQATVTSLSELCLLAMELTSNHRVASRLTSADLEVLL